MNTTDHYYESIKDYLIAKGEGDNMRKVSTDAYKAALRIATLAIKQELENQARLTTERICDVLESGGDKEDVEAVILDTLEQSLSPSEAGPTLPSENNKES